MMATIGVTRGFGDHDLKVHGTDVSIKPFLSSCPEVGSFFTFTELPPSKRKYKFILVLPIDIC